MCNLDGFIAIPFDGFDNYLINQKGEVWSIKKGSYARVLIRSGYRAFYLCHRGSGKKKKKWLRACRGVAKAFIPNPENKPCVNHIDGNKLNDNIENLEWVTYKENSQHAIRIGLTVFAKGSTENRRNAGLRNRGINNIMSRPVKSELTGDIFVSVTDAATYYKITVPAIINAIKGYNGYKNKMQWRYLTDEEIANLKVKTSKP